MPKIIEGAREKILTNAKRRLFEKGYLHLSLREVAKESGIATGTIYNYFANKYGAASKEESTEEKETVTV